MLILGTPVYNMQEYAYNMQEWIILEKKAPSLVNRYRLFIDGYYTFSNSIMQISQQSSLEKKPRSVRGTLTVLALLHHV